MLDFSACSRSFVRMDSTNPQKTKTIKPFAERLLNWYARNAREMPWRIPPQNHDKGERADPYRVWLSEVMLQQTQVATVKEYFLKFTTIWPSVHDLAAADLEDILKAWAGLGYYSRARNLKKCADTVVLQHNGIFPDTVEGLKALPGIGDYTASAIASITFDVPTPVIDGNIERVTARHRRIETKFPAAKKQTREILEQILSQEKPGEFAQAMMDLGATICTPRNPVCALCPLNDDCEGRAKGDAETFPRKEPKKAKPTRVGAAFILLNDKEEIFLCKRPEKGLLGGMTQVPTTGWTASEDGATGSASAPFKAEWKQIRTAKHTFTHFQLELEVWSARLSTEAPENGWWCAKADLAQEALPKLMLKVLENLE